MYAEIKTNSKIMINRLDDSERLLLKDIYEKSKDPFKKIGFTEMYDDMGTFGGMFVEITDLPNLFNRASDITMVKGDSRVLEWKFYTKNDVEITETLSEVIFTCKADRDDLEALIQYTMTAGQITKRQDGFYTCTIPVATSQSLPVGTYYYEITMLKNTTPLMKQTTAGSLIVIGNNI